MTYTLKPYHPLIKYPYLLRHDALQPGEYMPVFDRQVFLGVKAASAWGWRPHHLHVPNVMKIWEPKPPGTLWATPGLLPLFDRHVVHHYTYINRNVS